MVWRRWVQLAVAALALALVLVIALQLGRGCVRARELLSTQHPDLVGITRLIGLSFPPGAALVQSAYVQLQDEALYARVRIGRHDLAALKAQPRLVGEWSREDRLPFVSDAGGRTSWPDPEGTGWWNPGEARQFERFSTGTASPGPGALDLLLGEDRADVVEVYVIWAR